MGKFLQPGKYLLVISLTAFGLIQIISGKLLPELAPTASQYGPWLAWLTGILLITLCLSMLFNYKSELSSLIIAAMLLADVLLLHVPRLASNPWNGGWWTGALEIVCLMCGALMLSGSSGKHEAKWINMVINPAPYVFAIALAAIGLQHFIYIDYIVYVIPEWMPGKLFWGYFTGVALIAACFSIAISRGRKYALPLLAIMFMVWVLILHVPRVIKDLDNQNEWTSMLVAVAVAGIALILDALTAKSLTRDQTSIT